MVRSDVLLLFVSLQIQGRPMNDAILRFILIVISAVTVITGILQLMFPSALLNLVAASSNPISSHLFGTVGMFMLITGALFLQSLLRHSRENVIPLWIGVQKTLAATLLMWAWYSDMFLSIVLLVAGFDAVSGVLCFVFWRRMSK